MKCRWVHVPNITNWSVLIWNLTYLAGFARLWRVQYFRSEISTRPPIDKIDKVVARTSLNLLLYFIYLFISASPLLWRKYKSLIGHNLAMFPVRKKHKIERFLDHINQQWFISKVTFTVTLVLISFEISCVCGNGKSSVDSNLFEKNLTVVPYVTFNLSIYWITKPVKGSK